MRGDILVGPPRATGASRDSLLRFLGDRLGIEPSASLTRNLANLSDALLWVHDERLRVSTTVKDDLGKSEIGGWDPV